jgi:hypothetical protein
MRIRGFGTGYAGWAEAFHVAEGREGSGNPAKMKEGNIRLHDLGDPRRRAHFYRIT